MSAITFQSFLVLHRFQITLLGNRGRCVYEQLVQSYIHCRVKPLETPRLLDVLDPGPYTPNGWSVGAGIHRE